MPSSRIIDLDLSYHRPASLAEALDLLREEGARILAGGTDLLIRIKTGQESPRSLVHLLGIGELQGLEFKGELRIGAATQLFRLEEDELLRETYPAVFEAVKSLGGTQVRNMATLAGNLCNASPSADMATPLLVLEARVEIAGKTPAGKISRRTVPLEAFFIGPGETVLARGELVTAVIIPQPPENSASAFCKIGRVTLDMAKISCSVYVEREGRRIRKVRVAVGGAAPRPVRAAAVEKAMAGRELTRALLAEAAQGVGEDISPITDIRSTREYRREVAAVIIRDTLLAAWERCGGKEIR